MNFSLETFWQLLVVALLIEAIVNNLKPLWDKTKAFQIDNLISLVLAIVVCVLVGVDIFALVGLPMIVPYVGSVLTGILVCRGANVLHELVIAITTLRGNMQTGGSK